MELTEQDYFDAFGVKAPAEESAENTETATETVADENQVEETASSTEETHPQDGGEPSDDGDDQETGELEGKPEKEPKESKKQDNQKNAERRIRKTEKENLERATLQARQEAKEESDKVLQEVFSKLGIVDPESKKPITNLDEFNRWKRGNTERKLKSELKSGEIKAETLTSLVQDVVEQSKPQTKPETAEPTKQTTMNPTVASEMERIKSIDPTMVDLKTILSSPLGADFKEGVSNGGTFISSYLAAKKIADTKAQAKTAQGQETLKQAKAQAANSKGHLQTHKPNTAKTAVEVTKDEMGFYKRWFPDMSAKEIRAMHEKNRTK